jgi:hypothetical protein
LYQEKLRVLKTENIFSSYKLFYVALKL